jgi:ATP-binding protein involved in chromosome partitioning
MLEKMIEDVKNKLEKIIDPDLGQTLASINAIKNIDEVNEKIVIELELPAPTTYSKNDYLKIFEKTFTVDTYSKFELKIIEKPTVQKRKQPKHSKVKHIIAISSGKGGVGKSTIAANIATELALQGAKVGILDSDIYGPSQTIMFGVENEVMVAETDQHGNTVAFPVEKYGVKIASIGFVMNRDDAAALRGPMLARVFSLFFEQIEWGELDYLIFDLPPGTGDIHLTFVQQMQPDGVVLVTTPQEISLADVRRGADLFKRMNVKILGIIENMSYFIPPDETKKKYYIFGQDGGKKIGVELGLSVLGEVPFSVMMRENSDAGKPIVLSDTGGFQKQILKDITANMVSELRRNQGNHQV